MLCSSPKFLFDTRLDDLDTDFSGGSERVATVALHGRPFYSLTALALQLLANG
jgi:hypothetical protein